MYFSIKERYYSSRLKINLHYNSLLNHEYSYLQCCFYCRTGLRDLIKITGNEKVFVFCLNICIRVNYLQQERHFKNSNSCFKDFSKNVLCFTNTKHVILTCTS
jgi:hypothetical protein